MKPIAAVYDDYRDVDASLACLVRCSKEMVKLIAPFIACVSWASAAAADQPVTVPPMASRQVHILDSERQRGPTRVRVLLPDNYSGGKRYRVLYLLPVEAGNQARYGDGLAEAKRLDLPNRYGVICVVPEFSDLPWYADHPTDDKLQQETYFINEVLPLIESNYSVEEGRQGRLLVGFSKSGWGALALMLRHQELFEKAAAWDAPLAKNAPDQFGMQPIFGSRQNFERYELTRLIKQVAAQLGDKPRLIHLGFGNFRKHHAAFEVLLGDLKIPHIYHDGPPRKHSWSSGWLAEAADLLLREDS